MDDSDELDLFAEAMGKVKPLQNSQKVHTEQNRTKTKQRLNAIQRTKPLTVHSHATSHRAKAANDTAWVLIADGISRETIKRLAGGQPPIGLSFDLHGMTRDAALSLLQNAFEQAMAEAVRTLCIVHGRGLHSQEGKPILKHAVYHWLQEGPFAHAILAAIPQPGSGGGACLVLLRRQYKQ